MEDFYLGKGVLKFSREEGMKMEEIKSIVTKQEYTVKSMTYRDETKEVFNCVNEEGEEVKVIFVNEEAR